MKRKSKRISTNKRKIISKRTKSRIKKERKLNNKKKITTKKKVVVTEEDKKVYEEVKLKTLERNAEYCAEEELPLHMEQLKHFFNDVDAFIEVIDDRDRENSRAIDCEGMIINEQKPLFVFRSHIIEGLSYQGIENLIELTDINQVKDYKTICIFGQRQCGKFSLSQEIEKYYPDKKFIYIQVDTDSNEANVVFRKADSSMEYDPVEVVASVFDEIPKNALKEYYYVTNVEFYNDFLADLAEIFKISHVRDDEKMSEAAKIFVNDVRNKKIGWWFNDSKHNFIFSN